MTPHEDISSPHENTTSPQDPSRERSASGWGFFWFLGEATLFLLAAFVATQFFITDGRSDAVAWILLVVAVVFLVDIVRRVLRARQLNSQAAQAAKLHERQRERRQDPSSGEMTGR